MRPAAIDQTIRHAVDAVRARSEMRHRAISLRISGEMMGMFDPQKIERAFINLVLNACEASEQTQSEIAIDIHSSTDSFEIRVIDHGRGVPAAIRNTLFDPFVSFGKSNGTGLGLAIVDKVIHDHGGSVTVEETSLSGTTFLVKIPRQVRGFAGSNPTSQQLAFTALSRGGRARYTLCLYLSFERIFF